MIERNLRASLRIVNFVRDYERSAETRPRNKGFVNKHVPSFQLLRDGTLRDSESNIVRTGLTFRLVKREQSIHRYSQRSRPYDRL